MSFAWRFWLAAMREYIPAMRTIIIATLAGVLAMAACKSNESAPSNENQSTAWLPLMGRSLVGETALAGPDMPLSTEQMIEIARRYYLRIRVADYELTLDFSRRLTRSPHG